MSRIDGLVDQGLRPARRACACRRRAGAGSSPRSPPRPTRSTQSRARSRASRLRRRRGSAGPAATLSSTDPPGQDGVVSGTCSRGRRGCRSTGSPSTATSPAVGRLAGRRPGTGSWTCRSRSGRRRRRTRRGRRSGRRRGWRCSCRPSRVGKRLVAPRERDRRRGARTVWRGSWPGTVGCDAPPPALCALCERVRVEAVSCVLLTASAAAAPDRTVRGRDPATRTGCVHAPRRCCCTWACWCSCWPPGSGWSRCCCAASSSGSTSSARWPSRAAVAADPALAADVVAGAPGAGGTCRRGPSGCARDRRAVRRRHRPTGRPLLATRRRALIGQRVEHRPVRGARRPRGRRLERGTLGLSARGKVAAARRRRHGRRRGQRRHRRRSSMHEPAARRCCAARAGSRWSRCCSALAGAVAAGPAAQAADPRAGARRARRPACASTRRCCTASATAWSPSTRGAGSAVWQRRGARGCSAPTVPRRRAARATRCRPGGSRRSLARSDVDDGCVLTGDRVLRRRPAAGSGATAATSARC